MILFLKIILILSAGIVLIFLFFVGLSIYRIATRQSDREVASDVNISTDWLELTLQPPLRATKRVQHLIICVDGYDRSVEDTRDQILLPDGSTANSEVEILDESGKVYQLHPSLLISSGVGYRADSSLPQDRSFTRIRIRSDRPFQASKIFWENFNLK